MDAPSGRPPSRFVRGRARGGGGYRPYFYFRRKGRVIPAGGNPHGQPQVLDAAEGAEPLGQPGPSTRARGWNRFRGGGNNSRKRAAALDCTYLRPENYVAPEDAVQLQSILVENPLECPGWRLYFLRDVYDADSELAKRVKAVGEHYQRNPANYDLAGTHESCWFCLPSRSIIHDEQLKEVWPTLAEDMRQRPLRTLAALGAAIHTVVKVHVEQINSQTPQEPSTMLYVPRTMHTRKIYVRPEEFAPVERMTSISHARVDTMMAVRGIVSSIEEPTYEFAWRAYQCTRCRAVQALRGRGQYFPKPYNCKQTKCTARDNFVELRSSPYTRLAPRQIIRIEESNLSLLPDYESTLPVTLEIELRHDLVDAVHLGQEVVITGVLKLRNLGDESDWNSSGEMQPYLRALSVQKACHVKREFSQRDLDAISMINSEPNSFKLLVQSLVPEVHGYEIPKAACLLSLFGSGGSQLNEDGPINVLLVGDPGIGKSKLLQSCAQITERGAHVSGKRGAQSAQKLGHTLVNRSKRLLQAGALLSASSTGHCTIDDVDKLASKQALLLQSMQSGVVGIPLAGSFGTFQAHASIIASANPQRGQYHQERYLLQNIRIMPALLKEFHLVYVLLDKPTNMARDVSLTEHVRALHAGAKKRAHIAARYSLKPKSCDSICESTFGVLEEGEDSIMQEDFDLDKRLALNAIEDAELDLLPPVLMKKFIAFARQNVKPLLNKQAAEAIKKYFLNLRQHSEAEHEHSQIGAGQLLGLVHLSQARARLDLSHIVTPAHVREVISVLTESMAQTSLGGECGQIMNTVAASASGSKSSQLRAFLRIMQLRSAALGRRIFEYEELKEMGTRAGIMTGIADLVDQANLQGHLLKKGINMYEVVPDR
ncbi:DNA replication licensing factor REC [Scaptodrosophila lebanonensis]|uniref:DNA replication licensing factor REC n=1 Tax=Drosophila lebanonensis TaxID=7225 RepID=A0A6J2TE35_DROLE|nr:DNA replication licensing factor REC [Scaptodrosophila lebanonensis]